MNAEFMVPVLGRVSLQAGVLVLLVLLAQWLFRKQLTPRWRCALWMVVMVRLVLPFSPGSAASVFNLVPRWEGEAMSPGVAPTAPREAMMPPAPKPPQALSDAARPGTEPRNREQRDAEMAAPTQPTRASLERATPPPLAPVNIAVVPPTPAPRPGKLSTLQLLFWVWLGGALALGGWIGICAVRLSRRCRGLPALTDPALLAARDECARRLGLRGSLVIVESPLLSSPALFGLWHPRLILPEGFTGQFSEQELRFVMLHEMGHLKRHDLWFNWVVTLLQIVHWFNPLVWLGFSRWRSDRELACDALALEAAGGNQHREYGRTILHLLERFTHRVPSPGLVGILEDRRQLRRRISMIASFKPGPRWGVLSVGLFALLAVIGLTDAQTPKPAKPAPSAGARADSRPAKAEEYIGADPIPAGVNTNVEMRTLIVTVRDADGKPMPGAEVHVPYLADWKGHPPRRLTDAGGRFTVRYPQLPKEIRQRMSNFSVSARHPEFASRAVMWTSSGGDVYAGLPDEVTLTLERGRAVGGTVQDERGQPVRDVRVLLSGSGYRGFMGNSERMTHEYSELQQTDPTSPAAITDASGRWSFGQFPKDLNQCELTLIRPDDAREVFSTGEYDGLNRRVAVSMEELKAGTAVMALRDGVTVRGMVVDEKGNPLPGVTIKEGYGHGNIVRVSEFTTDSRGRFERPHRAPRQWIYTASRADRGTVSAIAQVESAMPEIRIVLPPATPWSARVTDEHGTPVADAEFTLDRYRTEGQILDWTGQADADGRFVWTNPPTAEATFYVGSKSLGASLKLKLVAGEPERHIVLNKRAVERIQVRVKATDAASGKPVNVRTAAARFDGGGSPFKTLASPNAASFTFEIQRSEIRVGIYPSYELMLEADGYEALTMDSIDFDLGDQALALAFRRSTGFAEITVLQPDGQPAAGARLWARASPGDGMLFINAPGRYHGDRLAKAQADDDGRLRLPSAPADAPVVIAHTSGFLETTMADARRQSEARLAHFGALEGRLLIAGEPGRGVTLNLATLAWAPSLGVHLGYTTTTGPDGRFTFTQVPPGQYKLYRWALPKRRDTSGLTITETYQMPVTIVAGRTNVVEYSSLGRPVIGQATPSPADVAVDWQHDVHLLTLKQPVAPAARANREDYATLAAFLKANNASYQSESQVQLARQARVYALGFEADGSFRIEDVPPGTYELRLRVTRPDESERRNPFGPQDELGSLVREVIVPEGREALDLGALTVPMKESAPARTTPPVAFSATSLEGQPLTLAQFKGTNVLLVIWAAWSERSLERLAELQSLRAQWATDPRLVFLAANLDDDIATARQAATGSGWQGRQCWLDEAARAALADAFDINALPAVYLLDTGGRIVAREMEGDRVPATLKRVLARK